MIFNPLGPGVLGAWIAIAMVAGAAAVAADATALPPLPHEVDLRGIFRSYGLDVRSQGSRGTCSVFTVTDAIEYAVARKEQKGVRLSPEFLNWASNDAIGHNDDGGFFSDLWIGYLKHGVCLQQDLPYHKGFDAALRPSDEAFQHAQSVKDAKLRLHWIKEWDVKTGLTDAHILAIKRTLVQKWPVCGGFRWPKQQHWKDGVLEMAPPEGVFDGHSVLLVGYRDDPAQRGGGVFLFRNTARANQDCAMTYEYARAYMNDAAWVEAPGAPDPVVKEAAAWNAQLLSPMTPAPVGRNRRVSSNEQPNWHDGNMDMTWLGPGESLEMPLLEGPGVITHMWFTSHAGWVGQLNALSLRIYWDGSREPGVEVPLGDFFAIGQGKPAVVESVPVQVSPTGAMTCYWRMPFAQSARIVVTNDNPDRGAGLYWQVDYTQLDSIPQNTPYFYARYRQSYPATMGHDYTIAELSGRGQYVGTVMSLTLAQDGWFGEGDDYFYIDGEEVPSLQGTGSEDYFNDAWGLRPRTSHFFGSPRWQGDGAGDSGVCYRWHLADAVNFSRSLKLEIEHKGNHPVDTEGFFFERPDFFSSVSFWYQEGQPGAWPALPAWEKRRIPWEEQHLVKAFLKAQTTGEAKVKIDTSGLFGARPVLEWPNTTAGAMLTLPFEAAGEGRYAVRLTAAGSGGNGVYDVELDGKKIATADFRGEEEIDLLLGTHALSKGGHTIAFKASADHPGPLGVEMLRLLRLPPEAKREVKTHNEAHFVRLGIGRALYAYRLAYGKLPESPQVLIDAGVMSPRYLKDENQHPLKWRRDGDAMEVESTGPEPWKHRWTGLDPRR